MLSHHFLISVTKMTEPRQKVDGTYNLVPTAILGTDSVNSNYHWDSAVQSPS